MNLLSSKVVQALLKILYDPSLSHLGRGKGFLLSFHKTTEAVRGLCPRSEPRVWAEQMLTTGQASVPGSLVCFPLPGTRVTPPLLLLWMSLVVTLRTLCSEPWTFLDGVSLIIVSAHWLPFQLNLNEWPLLADSLLAQEFFVGTCVSSDFQSTINGTLWGKLVSFPILGTGKDPCIGRALILAQTPPHSQQGPPWHVEEDVAGLQHYLTQVVCCCPVAPVRSSSCRPHGLQHARHPCPFLFPRVCSNSYPLSRWCHQTISSAVIPFSSRLQSFPASKSFPMSRLFPSGDRSIGASASLSVLPMNIQDWSPLGLTGLLSLQSKELKSLFQHHSSKASVLRRSAFFMVQLSHPYTTTGKTTAFTRWTLAGSYFERI